MTCLNESFSIESAHLMLLEPNTPYQIEILSPSSEIYTYFIPDTKIERFLNWPRPYPGVRILKLAAKTKSSLQITEALEEMFHHSNGVHPDRLTFAENSLERALLLAHLINPNQQQARLDARIVQVMNFIESDISTPITLKQLAGKAHLSPSRFTYLFNAQTGKTPMEYVEERRLTEAQKILVATNKTIGEISEICGFQNQFHFSTRFRKYTGKSPGHFRHNPSE
ncbi:MAG: AraC family transcriptional regulator [Chthoniobacterales bacterium]